MILYDTKKWWDSYYKVLISFFKANNYRRLLKFMFVATLYATTLTLLNIEWAKIQFHLDPIFFSLVGIIISLFLVFRLNTSYSKWWEGRILWGNLVNNSRNLSGYFAAIIPDSRKKDRERLASHISNYALSLKNHLRNSHNQDELDLRFGANERIDLGSGNIPHKIATELYREIHDLHAAGDISEIDKRNLKTHIENLVDILGACERIRNTPIPFSHSSFIKVALLLYTLLLPFGLVNDFMYLTIPVTAVMTFALFGVEIISEELEEPFGKDPNDLPLKYLSELIRNNVYSILKVDLPPSVGNSEDVRHKHLTVRF